MQRLLHFRPKYPSLPHFTSTQIRQFYSLLPHKKKFKNVLKWWICVEVTALRGSDGFVWNWKFCVILKHFCGTDALWGLKSSGAFVEVTGLQKCEVPEKKNSSKNKIFAKNTIPNAIHIQLGMHLSLKATLTVPVPCYFRIRECLLRFLIWAEKNRLIILCSWRAYRFLIKLHLRYRYFKLVKVKK